MPVLIKEARTKRGTDDERPSTKISVVWGWNGGMGGGGKGMFKGILLPFQSPTSTENRAKPSGKFLPEIQLQKASHHLHPTQKSVTELMRRIFSIQFLYLICLNTVAFTSVCKQCADRQFSISHNIKEEWDRQVTSQ